MQKAVLRDIISRRALIPVGKTYSGRDYFKARKYRRFLEDMQYRSLDELQSHQDSLIKAMVHYAYENVPYYHDLFVEQGILPSDIRGREDLPRIPFLTKKEVNRNMERLVSRLVRSDVLKTAETGGTTGTPIRFYRDQTSEYRIDANNWRFWKYCGYELGMGIIKLWGSEKDLLESTDVYGKLRSIMHNETVLNFFDVSDESLRNYATSVQKKRAVYWKGYSSAVLAFVRFLKRTNTDIPLPQAVILTADKIGDDERTELDAFFNRSVFSEYGCREFSIIGFECPVHDGIHVSMENMVVEIIEDANESGYGEVVVTSLTNWAMPFIRYRLGDSSKFLHKRCPCGVNLPVIAPVAGRITDFVVTKTGKLIHGEFFAHLLYGTRGFEHYQAIQKQAGKIELYLERNEFFAEGELITVKARFNEMIHDDLDMNISVVEAIEKHRSGKRRPVISEIIKDYV